MFPIMKYSNNDTNNDDDDDDDDHVLEKYIDHAFDPYASDGDYDSDTWNKYCDQINKSEGFDVDLEVFPRGCDMAPFHPIPYFKEFPKLVKDLEALADSALLWFNTEHSTKYELVEIEKVVQQYWHYFLTFKAKDHEQADADAPHKTFQARVFDGLKGPDVKLCRIKN